MKVEEKIKLLEKVFDYLYHNKNFQKYNLWNACPIKEIKERNLCFYNSEDGFNGRYPVNKFKEYSFSTSSIHTFDDYVVFSVIIKEDIYDKNYHKYIFDHAFASNLFGVGWIDRIREMVVYSEPLEYIKVFIQNKKVDYITIGEHKKYKENKKTCPTCDSINIKSSYSLENIWRCKDCSAVWTESNWTL